MQPLDASFNRTVVEMAQRAFPHGFDVSDRAPSTFADLYQHVSLTGRMLVWAGASETTIYRDATVNWASRALHDSCHLAGQHDFTVAGEIGACERQIATIRHAFPRMPSLWERIMRVDVIDQTLHLDATGEFIADQYAFTIERLGV